MPDRDITKPYIEHTVPIADNHNRAEDEPDLEGYDEAQRAEIAEAEGVGPTDGVIMTDLTPDYGGDLDDQEIEDDEDDLPIEGE
jgi:DNA-directed RNA polymerase subunit delta